MKNKIIFWICLLLSNILFTSTILSIKQYTVTSALEDIVIAIFFFSIAIFLTYNLPKMASKAKYKL